MLGFAGILLRFVEIAKINWNFLGFLEFTWIDGFAGICWNLLVFAVVLSDLMEFAGGSLGSSWIFWGLLGFAGDSSGITAICWDLLWFDGVSLAF